MNNQLKKFFLLPSLLLANAYLLVGTTEIKININVETYSEKIKLSSVEEIVSEPIYESKEVQTKPENINSVNVLLLTILSLSLACILSNKIKFKIKDALKKLLNNLFLIQLKNQKEEFLFIKTLQKTFHSIYQKIFFYSFVL